MSQGDQLFGLETYYKGIKMRSRLEAKFAFLLDSLVIIWIYEPKTFMLSNGITYKPDFYLPELNQWIETKGKIEDHNKEISKRFVVDNHATLILISSEKVIWYSFKDGNYADSEYQNEICEEVPGLQIVDCSKCGKKSFCDLYGYWYCRACKFSNGDADIMCSIGENSWSAEQIDISNIESIKEFLKQHEASLSFK